MRTTRRRDPLPPSAAHAWDARNAWSYKPSFEQGEHGWLENIGDEAVTVDIQV
jgi:hypothetical protein